MDNKQLTDYISKARQGGHNDDQIKSELKKSGWPDNDIEAALATPIEIQAPSPGSSQPPFYQFSAKNRRRGLMWLIGPVISFILVLVIYAVAVFIINALASPEAATDDTAVNVLRIIVGFLGLASVASIFVGFFVGIRYLNKKELVTGVTYDQRSGQGKGSEVPDEIKGWNWGAVGLNWIWGIYHGVWISLLVMIPYFAIIWIFVLGAKGNEWAWRARQWESVEKFHDSQKKWSTWGVVFFVIWALGVIGSIGQLVGTE
jgi:hypothetical protein